MEIFFFKTLVETFTPPVAAVIGVLLIVLFFVRRAGRHYLEQRKKFNEADIIDKHRLIDEISETRKQQHEFLTNHLEHLKEESRANLDLQGKISTSLTLISNNMEHMYQDIRFMREGK